MGAMHLFGAFLLSCDHAPSWSMVFFYALYP